MKKEPIERYDGKELFDVFAHDAEKREGKSMATGTDGMFDRAFDGDGDDSILPIDWSAIRVVMPGTKSILHMRIDSDILEYFKNQGKGYQRKINAVLRSYVERFRD